MKTSMTRGTFVSVKVPWLSNVEARIGRAEFLAPLIRTTPSNLRQKSGGDLDEIDAASQDRSGKTSKIANDAAAQRNDHIAPFDAGGILPAQNRGPVLCRGRHVLHDLRLQISELEDQMPAVP